MGTLNYFYDESRDVMVIEGMNYSGELFRAFAEGGLELYIPFDFIERKDGVVTIRRLISTSRHLVRKDFRWHIGNFLINCGAWLLYQVTFTRDEQKA